MFIALDASKNRISIENAAKENQYFCPICGEPLTIRATDSLTVRTHFAHKRGTECLDNWSHDMSEWHLAWQQEFPEENREVVIENDGVKHRADICIGKTVMEFQHSPITAEEIAKRNNFYISCGYNVVWVFFATNHIKNFLDESIDPMKCGENDLVWKRAKRQFIAPMPPQVTTFIQYRICTSSSQFPNQEFDIMLLLTKNSPKEFVFFKTVPYYIMPSNFLKEFGISLSDETLSISQIINLTKQHIQKLRQQKYEEARSKQLNALWNAKYRRPVRRFRL